MVTADQTLDGYGSTIEKKHADKEDGKWQAF
jgi:hypothetical protein